MTGQGQVSGEGNKSSEAIVREMRDAWPDYQSTAALMEVPGSPPVIENRSVPGENGSGYPPEQPQKVVAHASLGSVAGAPAGTQAPPVDTTTHGAA